MIMQEYPNIKVHVVKFHACIVTYSMFQNVMYSFVAEYPLYVKFVSQGCYEYSLQ